MGDPEDFFIIDKSGAENHDHPVEILYDFKELQPDQQDSETSPVKIRRGVVGKRYHEVDNFHKFRPGRLSHELRRALDIGRHEIPIHVYRMRTLGYPPGWLKRAVVGSELTIINSVSETDTNCTSTLKYNRGALIGYPGFNVDPHPSCLDDYEYLDCPPMQKHHMLDNFYASLSNQSRVLLDNPREATSSLENLQAERQRLLDEINRLNAKISPQAMSTAVDNEASTKYDQAVDQFFVEAKESAETKVESEKSTESLQDGDPVSQVLTISSSEEGTPTLLRPLCVESGHEDATFTPLALTKRPSLEAFSVGIQPFEPFKNLPCSEGAYKRVLQSLKNSRTSLTVEETCRNTRHRSRSPIRHGSNMSPRDHPRGHPASLRR